MRVIGLNRYLKINLSVWRKMKLNRNETKRLQGIAILFMLGLHLFNRSDIADFYDVNLYLGGGASFNPHILHI